MNNSITIKEIKNNQPSLKKKKTSRGPECLRAYGKSPSDSDINSMLY